MLATKGLLRRPVIRRVCAIHRERTSAAL